MKPAAAFGMAFQSAGRKGDGGKGKRWMAIFIGVIMLSSVAGFVISFNPSSQADTFRYSGLTFRQNPQGFYSAELGGKLLEFLYRPEDVSDIEVAPSIIGTVTGSRALYITYDFNSTFSQDMALLQFEAGNVLEARYGIFVQPAFTGENPLNISVVGCRNATAFVPVLLIQAANITAISADPSSPSCIVVSAPGSTGFSRVADRLKYAILAGDER